MQAISPFCQLLPPPPSGMPVQGDDAQINTRYVVMLTLNVFNTTIVMMFYHFALLVQNTGLKTSAPLLQGLGARTTAPNRFMAIR